jgi:uncharacterized protein (DUF58 family)
MNVVVDSGVCRQVARCKHLIRILIIFIVIVFIVVVVAVAVIAIAIAAAFSRRSSRSSRRSSSSRWMVVGVDVEVRGNAVMQLHHQRPGQRVEGRRLRSCCCWRFR